MLFSAIESSKLARRLAAATVLAILLLAILLAGIARVAETPASGADGRLAMIAPGALGKVRFELAKIGVGKPANDPAIARQALSGMPLASDPLTALAAVNVLENPRTATAADGKLLLEALRRDPRSRAARILLLRQLAAKGDLTGAFDQLAVLSRLNPSLIEQIMEAITTRVGSVKQVDDALAALEGHDALYLPFVNRMTGKQKPREVIVRLSERLPAGIMNRPQIRQAIVKQLVDAGAYAEARTIWQLGNRSGASGLIHSPRFADQAAPPPFNWQLVVGPTGAAEYAKGGGLSVAYYDRNPGLIASQLLTLAPGSYRTSITFEALEGNADNVRLQIVCRGADKVLAEITLIRRKPGADRLDLGFAIPQVGCPAQIIAIVGVASERRGQMQLSIKSIDLAPATRP